MRTGHPDLAALVRGELSNRETQAAATHARDCDVCGGELLDVAVGHGLLTAAGRTLGPSRSGDVPPLAVDAGNTWPRRSGPPPRVGDRLRHLAVAAVVVGLAGGGWLVGRLVGAPDDTPSPLPVAVERTAPLEPVDPASTLHGQVTMSAAPAHLTRMTVDVGDLPEAGPGRFYYVWLLDPATNKMLALGVVSPEHRTSFEVPESLVGAYRAVDVSVEADDGNPAHSVTSVLRASYTPPAPTDS